MKESPNEYLRCEEGQLLLERCPPGVIFIPGQGCTDPTMLLHMHGLQVSGSGRVGDLCQYNTDCLSVSPPQSPEEEDDLGNVLFRRGVHLLEYLHPSGVLLLRE